MINEDLNDLKMKLKMNLETSYCPPSYRKNFFVHEIATFPVACCDANELINDVYENFLDFDFIPVKQDGKIIGVFEKESVNRNNNLQNLVREHIRQLDEEMLIEANAFLFELISKFQANSPYLLVLKGVKIEGIITRSDLLKLPVRVYAFSLVAELELLMKKIIQETCIEKDSDEWLSKLSENRQQKIDQRFIDFKNSNLDLEKFELTTLEDKATILKKSSFLTNKFCNDIGSVSQLRNALVHARDYAANYSDLQTFLNRLDNINNWISKLSTESEKYRNSEHHQGKESAY